MNKSTPLSQLPNASQQQNAFVNDQQKQMITSAQTAIQNIQMPQNTQIPPEIMNDDDATIQEVLNQINSQKAPSPPQIPTISPSVMPQQPPTPSPNMFEQFQMNNDFYAPMPPMMPMPPQPSPVQNVDMFVSFFADDIKLAGLVLSVYIMVNFIPIGSLLGKYFAIDKIPYHDILLKGLLCATIVVFAKKMISSSR
jgi:hypothetical protein